MKEGLIDDFIDYLKKSQTKSIRIKKENAEIEITPSLLNHKIFIDLALIAAVIIGGSLQKNIDLLPITFIGCLIIGMLWYDYNSINKIRIDLASKTAQIISRNAFKHLLYSYILRKETSFGLAEISSFAVRSNKSFRTDLKRYFVEVKLKDKSIKVLFSFNEEGRANTTAAFLNQIVRS